MNKTRYRIFWDDPLWTTGNGNASPKENVPGKNDGRQTLSDDRPRSGNPAGTEDDPSGNPASPEIRKAYRTEKHSETGNDARPLFPDGKGSSASEPTQETDFGARKPSPVQVSRQESGTDRVAASPEPSSIILSNDAQPLPTDRIRSAVLTKNKIFSNPEESEALEKPAGTGTPSSDPADRTDIERIVDERLSSLRVYVLESDITEAQNTVKTMVSRAYF